MTRPSRPSGPCTANNIVTKEYKRRQLQVEIRTKESWSPGALTEHYPQKRLLDSFAFPMVSKYLLRFSEWSGLATILSKQTNTADNIAPSPIAARMAGEERRMQILECAVSLFSQRGFRGTTTKEIAQAAGISEAMVFRHFATKEELYTAILDHKACSGTAFSPCDVVAKAVAEKDDRAVFEQFAFNVLNVHEDDTEFHRLLLHAALEGHELAAMFWERNVRPAYEFLGSYVRTRQAEGVMVEIDPRVVVRAFVGMVIHHSLNNTLWDRKRTVLKISNEEAARQFTNILLGGVLARKPARKSKINGSGNGSRNGRRIANGRSLASGPKK